MASEAHASGRLWRISSSGHLDDYEAMLVNGLTNCANPGEDVFLWRYGSWTPDVACSGVGDHLIVTARVRSALAASGASFQRVRSLFVTERAVDWRSWSDFRADLDAMMERLHIEEPDAICCPHVSGQPPPPGTPLHPPRADVVEIREPELWAVFGQPSLEARRTPPRHAVGRPGAGIYLDPFLYPNDVCVENPVRELLERFGAASAIEFEPLDVAWQ